MTRFRPTRTGVITYVVVQVVSALGPLVAFPALSLRGGSEGWSAAAVGIALGSLSAVLVDFGWAIVGPQRVARSAHSREVLRDAQPERVLLLLPVLPLVALLAILFSPDYPAAAALISIGMSLAVLSPNWYWVGLGRPDLVLVIDALPRMVFSIIAAAAMWAGTPVETYGVALILAAVCSFVAAQRVAGVRVKTAFFVTSRTIRNLRETSTIAAGSGIASLFQYAPTLIVATVNAAALPVYAAADRLARMGLNVLSALPARFQSWLGGAAVTRVRLRFALGTNVATGVLAGLIFIAVCQPTAYILFASTISIDPATMWFTAALVFLICTSRGLGLCLVALRREASITVGGLLAAPTAIIGVFFASPLGSAAVMVTLCCAELATIAVQLVAFIAGYRESPHRGTES